LLQEVKASAATIIAATEKSLVIFMNFIILQNEKNILRAARACAKTAHDGKSPSCGISARGGL
jgi:hypothetical protein